MDRSTCYNCKLTSTVNVWLAVVGDPLVGGLFFNRTGLQDIFIVIFLTRIWFYYWKTDLHEIIILVVFEKNSQNNAFPCPCLKKLFFVIILFVSVCQIRGPFYWNVDISTTLWEVSFKSWSWQRFDINMKLLYIISLPLAALLSLY